MVSQFILHAFCYRYHYHYLQYLHLSSIESAKAEFVGTALCSFLWATLCSFGAQELRALAAADPGGVAEQWLDDIESCKNAVSVLGSLFVFTLVFRFNACYDRWWEGRIHWVSCSREEYVRNIQHYVSDLELAFDVV